MPVFNVDVWVQTTEQSSAEQSRVSQSHLGTSACTNSINCSGGGKSIWQASIAKMAVFVRCLSFVVVENGENGGHCCCQPLLPIGPAQKVCLKVMLVVAAAGAPNSSFAL